MSSDHAHDLDSIARRIAANAGVMWDELSDYPGYAKNQWRDEARALIAAISPQANFSDTRV